MYFYPWQLIFVSVFKLLFKLLYKHVKVFFFKIYLLILSLVCLWFYITTHRPVCVSVQVAREAHFSGQSYLDLDVTNVPSLRNNFYASFSFRTDKMEGLLFYHRDQVGRASQHFLLP